jgi:uncharacterized membrane protein
MRRMRPSLGQGRRCRQPTDYQDMKKLCETIPAGSSALFILFKIVTEDKVAAEIVDKPRVLKTEAEQRLKTC